jgi:hypothetical protein
MTLKRIFDDTLRPGDPVIHRLSDQTCEYVAVFIDDIIIVKFGDYHYKVHQKHVSKFRLYMFFKWIGQKAYGINCRLGRIFRRGK